MESAIYRLKEGGLSVAYRIDLGQNAWPKHITHYEEAIRLYKPRYKALKIFIVRVHIQLIINRSTSSILSKRTYLG